MSMRRIWATVGLVIYLGMLVDGCAHSPEARRDKFISDGKQYMQKKDYARAILQFRNAAQVMPKDPEVYYLLGLAYADAQDYTTAVVNFQRALSLRPNDTAAQVAIAKIFAHTNDPELLKEAEKRLVTLMQGNAAGPDTLNTLALTELKLGNRGSAIERLEQALTQSPTDLSAALMLARTKLEASDAKGAEEVLKQAVASAPKSAEAHRFLGGYYFSQRKLAGSRSSGSRGGGDRWKKSPGSDRACRRAIRDREKAGSRTDLSESGHARRLQADVRDISDADRAAGRGHSGV